MARSANQKLKLLYLLRFLQRQSDERHPVTVADMIEELSQHDIAAERKSIYDDLETLRSFGADIVQQRGKQTGYYIGQRDFELPELKLLVDSIQSSKFITEKKTVSLIRKLENLASVHDARMLERQVYVRNRVKSMNESVYYNVDEISNAINRDRMIRFRYFEFTVEKERQYRRGGAGYVLSPFALMWDDENYYMLAWDAEEARMKHFRVDKMSAISTLETARQGKEAFRDTDMSAYSKKVFGMFTGQESAVSEAALCQPPGRRGHRPLRQGRDAHARRAGRLHRHGERGSQPPVFRLGLRLRRRGGDPRAGGGSRAGEGRGARDRGDVRVT